MVELLSDKVYPSYEGERRNSREVGLDAKLLAALVKVGIDCPGFSERQKAIISDLVGSVRDIMFSQHSRTWPFLTLTLPKEGVADQDIGMWLELFANGVDLMRREGREVCINDVLVVSGNSGGDLEVKVVNDGQCRQFIDLVAMEKGLVHMVIQKGWSSWFHARGMPLYSPVPFVDNETDVHRKMNKLGVFDNGIEPPEKENKFHFPKLAEILRAEQAKERALQLAKGGTETESADTYGSGTKTAISQTDTFGGVQLALPGLKRSTSFSSDSGLQGMHRINQSESSTTRADLATNDTATSDVKGKGRATSPGSGGMQVRPEVTRGRSGTVVVKKPLDQETSDEVIKFRGRAASQSQAISSIDHFTTPPRRHSRKNSDGGDISPLTTSKTSPRKRSFVVAGAGSELGTPLPPVGTPSRRSLPKNTVEIHQALDEAPEIGEEMRAAVDRARRQENAGEQD